MGKRSAELKQQNVDEQNRGVYRSEVMGCWMCGSKKSFRWACRSRFCGGSEGWCSVSRKYKLTRVAIFGCVFLKISAWLNVAV